MIISETLGKLSGNNLFHSFEKFNINGGESATFMTTTSSIVNVISRVSGVEGSVINGSLKLDAVSGSKPNFFFINPNGVTFGAGAYIDVPGAFHVSTANNLKFSDGTIFTAGKGPDNTLTVAMPEAFGFLGGDQGAAPVKFLNISKTPIMPKPPYPIDEVGLIELTKFKPDTSSENVLYFFGRSFDITAGNIQFDKSNISAAFADIRLAAVGKLTTNVSLDFSSTFPFAGSININSSDISGSGTGIPIYLQAKNINLQNGSIVNGNIDRFRSISGETRDNNASIFINAEEIKLGQSVMQVMTERQTNSVISLKALRNISVSQSAIQVEIVDVSGIPSHNDTSNTNIGIEMHAPHILLDKGTTVSASSFFRNLYTNTQMPSIKLHADKEIKLDGDSSINVNKFDFGGYLVNIKTAAEIDLSTPRLVLMNGSDISADVMGTGDAGSVTITSHSNGALSPMIISGDGSGSISSSTFGPGNAGVINISGSELSINGINIESTSICSPSLMRFYSTPNGNAGSINIFSPGTIVFGPQTFLGTNTVGMGRAGQINISGHSVLLDDATLQSGSLGAAIDENLKIVNGTAGDAGSIRINASDAVIKNNSVVLSDTWSFGKAGSVEIKSDHLVIDGNGSRISSRAHGESGGETGDVSLNINGLLSISNGAGVDIRNDATVKHPEVIAPTQLSISARDIMIESGGQIRSDSTGNIDASNIVVKASNTLMVKDGEISTVTTRIGNGGTIDINAGKNIWLKNSRVSTSVLGSSGNGGDIHVTAPKLILEHGYIQANAQGQGASGGEVFINANALIGGGGLQIGGVTPLPFSHGGGSSVIQSAAPDGVSGEIKLANPQADIVGGLVELEQPAIDGNAFANNICNVGKGSSFTQANRGNFSSSFMRTLRLQTNVRQRIEQLTLIE